MEQCFVRKYMLKSLKDDQFWNVNAMKKEREWETIPPLEHLHTKFPLGSKEIDGQLYAYDKTQYTIKKISSIGKVLKNFSAFEKQSPFEELLTLHDIRESFEKLQKILKELGKSAKNPDVFNELPLSLYESLTDVEKIRHRLNANVLYDRSDIQASKEKLEFQYFYRGHSNTNYKMTPSVFRESSFFKNEHLIYRTIQIRNADKFNKIDNRLDLLTLMQHYGIPTRLLDITESSLIALYFAVSEQEDQDGEIIVYRVQKDQLKYFDSDTVEILVALATLTQDEKIELLQQSLEWISRYINKALKLIYQGDVSEKQGELTPALHKMIVKYNKLPIVKKLNNEVEKIYKVYMGEINPFDLFKVIPVQPMLTNERIIRQQGAFLVYGLMGENVAKQLTEKLMYQQDGKKVRFIIPAKSKSVIMNELNTLGFDAATIYPELDRVSEYIKNKFYEDTELEI